MATTAAHNLLASLPQSVAIAREPALLQSLQAIGIETTPCPAEAQEMADSLTTAIAYAAEKYQPSAYVIALADMPFIQQQTIAAIAQKLSEGAEIVIPVYQGQRGHPVGFSAKFTDELLALKGDEGARTIIKKHAEKVLLLECEDAGILRDIDTPEDLKN